MFVQSVIDDALEASVVGSFTRVGPAVRRRLFGWRDPAPSALAGRTVLITGPTSGLGKASAMAIAGLGARVVLVGRDPSKLAELRAELIGAHGDDRFPAVVADMGSLTSVRAAVERIRSTEPRLDVLVDNAGAIYPDRREGPDGIEATLALLVVGPFVLTAGLLPLLRATDDSRVVAVTSGGMYTQRLSLDDLEWRHEPYSGTRAYARAKRAQVSLMREWARRVGPEGVSFVAMHPGWADTPGVSASLPGFHAVMRPLLRTPADGADTVAWLASQPDPRATNGRLYLDRRPRPFDRLPTTRVTPSERRRLWDAVVDLAGVPDPAAEPSRGPGDLVGPRSTVSDVPLSRHE